MHRREFKTVEAGFALEPKGASPRLIQQVHGGKIVPFSTRVTEADGVLTSKPRQPLHIFTADCIPLLFFSNEVSAPIIAVHCGWRGALNRMAQNAMNLLKDFPVQVVVGPSILSCCFEVRADLIQSFEREGHAIDKFLITKDNQIFFNLVDYVVESQLSGAVIHREWSRCTYCSKPELPSFRRNKSTDPQIRSWIIKKA